MFSGIVETTSKILWAEEIAREKLVRVRLTRPTQFDDIKTGDSISSDGVCLTVETFDAKTIVFALAAETLAITNWKSPGGAASLIGREVNLERSLRMGDRIHGHWVTGHVDAAVKVTRVEDQDGVRIVDIEIPVSLRAMVWKKGSWSVNGVSLTVNSVDGGQASHCLIPETLSRTNLKSLKVGDVVNVEVDVFARALALSIETYMQHRAELKKESV